MLIGVDHAQERDTWKGKKAFHSDVMIVLSINKMTGAAAASSEYQLMIDHMNGRDECRLFVELYAGFEKKDAAGEIRREFKDKIGISVIALPVAMGSCPAARKRRSAFLITGIEDKEAHWQHGGPCLPRPDNGVGHSSR